MIAISRSALTIVVASLASLAACGDAFAVPAARSFAPTNVLSSATSLRAEAEESEGEAAEASAASPEGGEEGQQGEGGEEESKEDPEVTAIKEEIAALEAKIKSRRNDLASVVDSVEKYSKAGYARKVAEMDQIRKMRGAASKDNESTAKAAILQDFLPVLDELRALDEKYAGDDFAQSYKALRWDLNNAMTALGMSEYTAEVGATADPTRVVAVEEQYSNDFAKGAVISPVAVGLELQGNVMRMAECVVSLGSEADAKAAEEEAAAANDGDNGDTAAETGTDV
jgi:molecular chaperone GrpE (heat shock protein)